MTKRSLEWRLSRRGLLAGVGGAVALGQAGLPTTSPRAWADTAVNGDAFDALRTVWWAIQTGGDFDPADKMFADALARRDDGLQGLVARLVRDPGRTRVFDNLGLAEGEVDSKANNVEATARQLNDMARMWATNGSRWEGNENLLADVLDGLATLTEVVYHAEQPGFGNWWNWQIGAPQPFLRTCALVYGQLDAATLQRYLEIVDHFVPDPRHITYLKYGSPDAYSIIGQDANRVDLCEVRFYRGILGRDGDTIADARDALVESEGKVFATAQGHGNGFYEDGSFIAHENVAYTGAYGVDLIANVASLFALLGGSEWSLAGTDGQVLLDAVEKTYAPWMWGGAMMSAVRGRSLSRNWMHEHSTGHKTIFGILDLAQAVDEQTARRWRGLCRGWVERDTHDSLVGNPSVPQVALVKQMLDDSVDPIPDPRGLKLFSGMARAVHRGESWAVAISMASKRTAYYEVGNGENLRGFHTGDGMTNLYNDDVAQYSGDFWATVDPYRLAGITVDTKQLPNGAGGTWGEAAPEHAAWAGGTVSPDGAFGAVGMELEALDSPLRARKSWFCLPEVIVALGAGITGSSEGERVETIVENRNLRTDGVNRLIVDGATQPVDQGWQEALEGVRWAHLEGAGGYIFPDKAGLHALRAERTGKWRDINNSGPTDERTQRYLTLWFDHGMQPVDESYAYILAPGASPWQTAKLARHPGVQILANTGDVQAVYSRAWGLTAANFWAPADLRGRSAAHTVSAEQPCSVLVHNTHRTLTVSVSDPTQEQDTVTVTVREPGHHQWSNTSTSADTSTINVRRDMRGITITVDTRNMAGATQTITFHR